MMSTMSTMRKARTRGLDPHKSWLRRAFLQGTAKWVVCYFEEWGQKHKRAKEWRNNGVKSPNIAYDIIYPAYNSIIISSAGLK